MGRQQQLFCVSTVHTEISRPCWHDIPTRVEQYFGDIRGRKQKILGHPQRRYVKSRKREAEH